MIAARFYQLHDDLLIVLAKHAHNLPIIGFALFCAVTIILTGEVR